tara:strand:- start:1491 stop:1682 length:192 start_codon:yes stop_codon:yes gene_type:complete
MGAISIFNQPCNPKERVQYQEADEQKLDPLAVMDRLVVLCFFAHFAAAENKQTKAYCPDVNGS